MSQGRKKILGVELMNECMEEKLSTQTSRGKDEPMLRKRQGGLTIGTRVARPEAPGTSISLRSTCCRPLKESGEGVVPTASMRRSPAAKVILTTLGLSRMGSGCAQST